jgi:hypothetical protein
MIVYMYGCYFCSQPARLAVPDSWTYLVDQEAVRKCDTRRNMCRKSSPSGPKQPVADICQSRHHTSHIAPYHVRWHTPAVYNRHIIKVLKPISARSIVYRYTKVDRPSGVCVAVALS